MESQHHRFPREVPATDPISEADEDTLFTTANALEGIFTDADEIDLSGITSILDVGCGPGGWLHKVASSNPTIQVTGIDINPIYIDYAQACADAADLHNARFLVMDALQPLTFANASFDLVNIRNSSLFVPTQTWPDLLTECKRVLRTGGIARITEGEGIFTNKPGIGRFSELYNLAKKRAGFSFSGTGRYQGNVAMLGPLLRNAGFRYIQHKASTIDFSHGSKAHKNVEQIVSGMEPFLLAYKVITPEALTLLREEVQVEAQMEDFRVLWYVVTTWGEVPSM